MDMWEPFRLSIEQWAPNCRIVYDKFHIMQHANEAIDEVRRAEFFRKGGRMRGMVKGKRWLLLSRWVNLTAGKRQELNQLFALNRKVFKAYILKESLDRLWTYRYEGAMLNYLQRWMNQLRWQRLAPFQKLAEMLLDHLDGILNYCRDEGASGGSGGREWEYQVTAAPRTGIQKPALPAAKIPAHGGDQDRICGLQESGLKCMSCRIPAQSQNSLQGCECRRHANPEWAALRR